MIVKPRVQKDIERYFSEYSDEAKKEIEKAYLFSLDAHKGQKRKSGEDFFTHPLEVAKILSELKMGSKTVIAGLLHDVIEDTTHNEKEINDLFGAQVASFVSAVTNLTLVDFGEFVDSDVLQEKKRELNIESLRRLFLSMAGDIRVVLIKLADRLHNMRTLEFLPKEKRVRIAQETLEVFAPLANRLGMGAIKADLEDLSFKYLLPDDYSEIQNRTKKLFTGSKKELKKMEDFIKKSFKDSGIEDVKIGSRAKHFYSIFKKLKKTSGDFDQIYDLMALRIIVPEMEDCYKALGIIHTNFKPLIYRIKDYIALPKPNGYKSLHTTVFGIDGMIYEIQIRTKEMHEEAEMGVAAHWNYHEKKQLIHLGKSHGFTDKKDSWVKALLTWDKEATEDDEFFEGLKIDVFKDRIFIFSPKGDIYDLPEGSTPIDFAYAVHSRLGEKLIGVKVNGKICPIDAKLANRDIVEIITSSSSKGPKKDWLSFAITSKAKQNIRSYFRKKDKNFNAINGKNELEENISHFGYSLGKFSKEAIIKKLEKLPYKSLDDIYSAIGEGSLSAKRIASKLVPDEPKIVIEVVDKKELKDSYGTDLEVFGTGNLLFNIAPCCKPKKGDDILGFITKEKGISVHKNTCKNILNASKERILAVNWRNKKKGKLLKKYQIITKERVGMLKDICGCVSEAYLNILNINIVQEDPKQRAKIDIMLDGDSLEQFKSFERRLEILKDIFDYKELQ